MADPILYSFRRCPYAMRARLALLISGTTCEIREVKLAQKPAELIEASPKATVPVLVLPDGGVIEESREIMAWALAQRDPEGWLGRENRDLIAVNDGPFKHHLDRYKYPERHGSDPADHRTTALELLRVLDARLAAQANLCGDHRGLTDAAIFPFVRQFAETDRAWFDAQPLPHLQAWLTRHLASDLFAAIMVRLQPWRTGDAPTLFPAG
ncbi:glutathione S-transferase [Novosphingobium sp. JCM 18896]|uniref:glutathione S-transferase n=1 Tax=Novosphingobium sp. JCM 18896 TaxID=2989731 RepID=UPI00222268BB|nr:glutathione S-transferase [Novosphingobium sp. JCM 18896]MCW1430715.1 glutathione S-transferase [Novosphingobium sp. JCM 18896]